MRENRTCIVILYCPCLSSIHEKANCIAIFWTERPHSLGSCHFRGIWATYLPHKGGGVLLSALPKDTTRNLPTCSPQPPLKAERQAGKLWISVFKVFWYDSTREMNPRSTDCEAEALTTKPSRRFELLRRERLPTTGVRRTCHSHIKIFVGRTNHYLIFRTITRTYNLLFFSKMERAPYSPVRLMCGSGCALSPSSEQILCCDNRYQRNSTSLNSLFLGSKLLCFLRSNDLLSFPLRVCFLS